MNPSLHKKTWTREGFTLLELILAMVVLVIAMTITFQAFSGTIRGWRRGSEVMDGLKHGEFVVDQFAQAIDSTLYFYNARKSYAFLIEKKSKGSFPEDSLSFVTTSSAFVPEDSLLKNSPHRIHLFIDDDEEGNPALFATAFPAIADPEKLEEDYDAEPYLVSRAVQGLEVLLYDEDAEDWTTDEWEQENSVPKRLKLIIYIAPENEDDEPIVFERIIEIPIADSVELQLTGPSQSKKNNRGRPPINRQPPGSNHQPPANRNPHAPGGPPPGGLSPKR